MFGASFFLSILALTIGSFVVHLYLWRRLVRDNEWEHSVSSGLTLGLVTVAVLVPFIRTLSRLISNDALGVLQGLMMTWMLCAFYVAGLFALWDLGRWAFRNYKAMIRPAFDDSLSRAKYVLLFQEHNSLALGPGRFWNRVGTALIIFLGLSISAKAFFGAFKTAIVVESAATSPHIGKELEGFRILHLSDLHLSVFFNDNKFDTLIEKVQKLHPDMILLTGDTVDASNKKLKHGFERLGELAAPYGVYAVLGNHESYLGTDRVAEGLSSMGIIVLRNSALPIHIGKQTLCIAGVEDETSAHNCTDCGSEIDSALTACPAAGTRILLVHQPRAYVDWSTDESHTQPAPDVVFAGHTHGGQVWPFQFITEFFQTYLTGTYLDKDTTITVNNGIGISAPLARLGAPAEMTMFTLHAGVELPHDTGTSAASSVGTTAVTSTTTGIGDHESVKKTNESKAIGEK